MRTFWFGKYKGRIIVDIINEDFPYVLWCVTNVRNFNLTDEENKLYQRRKPTSYLSDKHTTAREYRDSFIQQLEDDFIDPNPFADMQSF